MNGRAAAVFTAAVATGTQLRRSAGVFPSAAGLAGRVQHAKRQAGSGPLAACIRDEGLAMRRISTLVLLSALAVLAPACGGSKKPKLAAEAPARVTTLGINTYLWRAALDTIAFMPLAQVDSNGGVIITDWYVSPQSANERVKVTVTVLDTELRADAVRVAVQRQTLGGTGWTEAAVRAGTVQRLEETILGRARDLRRNAVAPDR
jgi:hypothetical protein